MVLADSVSCVIEHVTVVFTTRWAPPPSPNPCAAEPADERTVP